MEEYLENTLFIGGLPGGATEDTLVGSFGKYGYVSGVTVLTSPECLDGWASSVSIILLWLIMPSKKPTHRIFRKKVNVTRAIVGMIEWPQWLSTSCNSGYVNGTIFVDGVGSKWSPYNLTRWQLESYFQMFGWLTYVEVPMNRFGHYRGFAFITFVHAYAAEEVLRRRFHVINGKVVEVSRAVDGELMESNNISDRGHHQPGGSSSRSDHIGGPATNNGVPQPGFGSFTSGTGVYGDQLLQRGYAWFPSGNPQNVPQVSLAPIGTRPYVPLVSMAPVGTRPPVSTYIYGKISYHANMSRDGGLAAATGFQNMHNRAPEPTMDQLGFVSENALADVNSSRDEYETPDFDGTAGQGFS